MKFEFWWGGKLIFWEGGGHKNWVLVGGFNCADWTVHLRDWATTMSLRGPVITLTKTRPKAEFDGMGRVGRVGRSRKVSFKFLQTLWAFRKCIYILVYKIKIVTNILMGFKIWCQVRGGGTLFSKFRYCYDLGTLGSIVVVSLMILTKGCPKIYQGTHGIVAC